jgi:hypothetical protein
MFDGVVTPPFCVLLICVAVLRDVTSLERSDRSLARYRPPTCDRYAYDNRPPVIGRLPSAEAHGARADAAMRGHHTG